MPQCADSLTYSRMKMAFKKMNESLSLSLSPSLSSLIERRIMIPIYVGCMIAGSLAQSLILIVVTQSRRIQSTTNYFIVSLACQGIVFLLVVLPCLMGLEFPISTAAAGVLCRVGMTTLLSCVACNQATLAATGVDRYNAVVSPIDQRFTFLNIKLFVAVSVGVAVLCACPVAVYTSGEPVGFKFSCFSVTTAPFGLLMRTHLFVFVGLFYGVCFLVVLGCYVRAVLLVWRVSHNSAAIRSVMIRRTLNYLPKARIQVLKILLVVTLTDLVIMSGLFAVLLATALVHWNGHFLCLCVFYFISVVQKPLFYFRMHRSFRQGCRETMCCCRPPRRAQHYRVTNLPFWEKRNDVNVNLDLPQPQVTSSASMLIFTTDKPANGH